MNTSQNELPGRVWIALMILFLCQCQTAGKTEDQSSPRTPVVAADSVAQDSLIRHVAKQVANHLPLTLTIQKLSSTTAPLIIAVYASDEHFLYAEGRIREFTVIPNGPTHTTEIKDLEYGEYAVVVFQDANSSGKMDRNKLGLPKEDYGMSNNFKPSLRKPVFDDCKFIYDEERNAISIDLIR